jgi:peptidoglycan/LPS O-acetylase OafA/YrhL
MGSQAPATLPALTSLRFLAALLVFLFHFPPAGAGWAVVAGEGHVGVNVFFVLSGFLITARYGEALARGETSLRGYFVRRAARILPLYYAVFVLSQLVSTGGVSFAPARLPEWTLTQGLFGESVHDLVVPTSWSLTVEECFYALAPPLFWVIAAARRRAPAALTLSAAWVLLAVTILLLGLGADLWTVLDGRGPGFLRSPQQVLTHTLFGRFCDFAAGAMAAMAWRARGPSVLPWLGRPAAAMAATAAATAAIVTAQWGMQGAGGLEGPRWLQVWAWGLLLAPAAAGLIVCLAVPANPVARALAWGPLVYLGKISYALYLVQLTPLGRGLFYRIIPRQDGGPALLLLYVGLSAVSVLLYELVEEPARKLILRRAGLARREPAAEASRPVRLAAAAVVALAVAGQSGSWALSSLGRTLGPVTLTEVAAAGVPDADVLRVPVADASRGRDVLLLGLPRRWREGWADDLHPPSALRVFADGAPVAFSRREPEGPGRAAFYRGPRAEYLALRLDSYPRHLLVVRETPGLAARVQGRRLLESPSVLAAIVACFALALALARAALRGRRAAWRLAVTGGLLALAAWWILELHHVRWSLALIACECVLLLVLALRAAWRLEESATPRTST